MKGEFEKNIHILHFFEKRELSNCDLKKYLSTLKRLLDCGMNEINVQSFNMLSVIGKGSYAKVILVRKKAENSGVYALKILKKKYVQKRKQEHHVMMERYILAELKHPFLVRLYHAFQSTKKLFFVLEYCPGGELFRLLSKK